MKMKYNKNISQLEIMEKYPYNATFIGVNEFNLESINEALELDSGFRLKTLDANYVHIYKNYLIILTKLYDDIALYAFSIKENIPEEVIQERRKLFFESLEPLE
jgi:hypothetical protein